MTEFNSFIKGFLTQVKKMSTFKKRSSYPSYNNII